MYLLWVIWKERNKIIFEDVTFFLDRVKSSFWNSFFSWACVYPRLDLSLVGCISHSFLSFLRDGKFLFIVCCPYISLFFQFLPCILLVYSFDLYIYEVY